MPKYVKDKYNIVLKDLYYKPACIPISDFNIDNGTTQKLKKELGIDTEIVCVYVGKFGDLYLEDEVFDFFSVCYKYWEGNFKILLLTNQSDSYLKEKASKFNIPFEIIIKKFVTPFEVSKYLSVATFAISPFKPIPTRKYCTPIKNGEYWAAGLPVVITKDISIDSDIINDNKIGYVLKELNKEEYLNACLTINKLINNVGIDNKIKMVAEKSRSFEIAKIAYSKVFNNLNLIK